MEDNFDIHEVVISGPAQIDGATVGYLTRSPPRSIYIPALATGTVRYLFAIESISLVSSLFKT